MWTVRLRRMMGEHPALALAVLTGLGMAGFLVMQWTMGVAYYHHRLIVLTRSPWVDVNVVGVPVAIGAWAVASAAILTSIRLRAGLSAGAVVQGLLWDLPLSACAVALLDVVGGYIAGTSDHFVLWFSRYNGLDVPIVAGLASIVCGGHGLGVGITVLHHRRQVQMWSRK